MSKENKLFVLLANAKWDSAGLGGNSSQQYARTLQGMGWPVAYGDTAGNWTFQSPEDITDPDNTIVMCDFPYSPYFLELFEKLRGQGCKTVCRIVDHWDSIDVDKHFDHELEPVFLRSADLVFASSPLSVERLRSVRPDISLLRNGVDIDHFQRAQKETAPSLARGTRTLGVVASFWIKRWLNIDPLLEYAQSNPQDVLHVIGNAADAFAGSQDQNIHLHGPRHWSELPGYINQFDACIVPYNSFETRYTNPVKVLEYLACHKPVVSCLNASIADYPGVFFYHRGRGFSATLNHALRYPLDADNLDRVLRENSWEKRLASILS